MSESIKLLPVQEETVKAFSAAVGEITRKATEVAFERSPKKGPERINLKEKYSKGLQMVGHILESVICVGEKALLLDQLDWGKTRLPHEGISPEQVLENFKIYRATIREVLEEKYSSEILPYLDFLITGQEKITRSKG